MGFEQPMPHFGMETQLGAATLAPSGFVGQLLLALAVVDVGHLGRVRTATACGAGSRELRSICAAQEELDAYFHEDLRRGYLRSAFALTELWRSVAVSPPVTLTNVTASANQRGHGIRAIYQGGGPRYP